MYKAAVRLFLCLLLAALAPLPAAPPHKASKISDLDDTVGKTLILSKFAALLQASGLGTFLSSRGPFTLFVPTNSAFSRLPPGMFDDLLRPQNKDQLQRIILFHIVNGQTMDNHNLLTAKSLVSCEGAALPVHVSKSGALFVDKARVIRSDIRCANGLMHQVDTLLMPPHILLVAGDAATAAGTNAAPANPATNDALAPGGDDKPAPAADSTNAAPAPAMR